MTSPPQPAAAAQLPPLPTPTQDTGVDLLKAANARMAALEAAVRARDQQLAAAQAELQAAQVMYPFRIRVFIPIYIYIYIRSRFVDQFYNATKKCIKVELHVTKWRGAYAMLNGHSC